MVAFHEACDACKSPHLDTHCKTKGCDWWKCRRCGSYGNDRNHVDVRSKRGAA